MGSPTRHSSHRAPGGGGPAPGGGGGAGRLRRYVCTNNRFLNLYCCTTKVLQFFCKFLLLYNILNMFEAKNKSGLEN
jgi:hypothetical protein